MAAESFRNRLGIVQTEHVSVAIVGTIVYVRVIDSGALGELPLRHAALAK
jgi:hypothetical protein